MSEIFQVGPSSIRQEPDTGFIVLTHVGVLDAELARATIETCMKLADPDKPAFMLMDERQATGITPEARKLLASSTIGNRLYLALYGGSFGFRAIANLAMKGMAMVSDRITPVMKADEASARAWLQEQQRAPRRR